MRLPVALWLSVMASCQAVSAQTADTIPALMARGAALVERGRPEEARRLYEAVVTRKPQHAQARLELGRLELDRGAHQEALEHLEIAVQRPLHRAFAAWHLLGRARLVVGDAAGAEVAFDEALRRAERFAPAWVGRAGATLALGRTEAAKSDLRRALALGGAQGLAGTLLAAVLAGEGRHAEAGGLLSGSGSRESVLDAFRRLLEWLPAEPRVRAAAAWWAAEIGALEAARCLAQGVAESAEPDPRLLETVARIQLAEGRAEDALVSIRRAIEMGHQEPETLALVGRAELGSMRIDEAVPAFRRALELRASLVDQIPVTGLTALAEVLGDEARESLAAHLEDHPDCSSGLYLLGMSAKRNGDLEAALEWFGRLAKLDESAGTRYVLAQIYRRLGDEERGRVEMDRFRELEQREEAEWLRRNDAFRRRLEAEARAGSEPLEALRIYRELAADDLATADDYVATGHLLADQGLHEDAREWFERVLELQPFRTDALEGLVRTFEGEPASEPSRSVEARLSLRRWACAGREPAPD